MDNDMRNSPGPGMAGLGNSMQVSLTDKEIASTTIKAELERLSCSLGESREILSGLESFANELCGPEEVKVQPETKEQEPSSLLDYIIIYNGQFREINGRLGNLSFRLRETLG